MEEVKYRRLTLLDILLIVVLILLPTLSAFLIYRERTAGGEAIVLTYQIYAEDVDRSLIENNPALFPKNTPVMNQNGTTEMGYLQNVEIHPHQIPLLVSGELVLVNDDQAVDLIFTVQVTGEKDPATGWIRVGHIPILAGQSGDFRIASFYCTSAKIIGIEIGEKE